MKPHKHCEVIKAWADGGEIQIHVTDSKGRGEWIDWEFGTNQSPGWHIENKYRVKPKTLKYRRYLWQHEMGVFIGIVNFHSPLRAPDGVEVEIDFIRWIDTDWQEVEV